MKNLALLLITLFIFSCSSSNQSGEEDGSFAYKAPFIGAWETTELDSLGENKVIVIVADGYLSSTTYNLENKTFKKLATATWEMDSVGRFLEKIEFDSDDSSRIGTDYVMEYTFSEDGNTLRFVNDDRLWTKVDDGTPGELDGAWLITGRKRDGEITRRTPGARKTMKILSGTRFQWIAYNTDNGELSGTGGGTYTTIDSTYTENIEFFSRDSSRVGASLEFTFALDSGEWHHSGLSSRGDPIYEIWTPRQWVDQE